MSRFDFEKIRKKAHSLYNQEVKISKGIQDEVKIFNERFPKELKPLAKFDQMLQDYEDGVFTSGNIGEFENSGTSVGGDLEYVNSGEYWTNSDLTKHDLKRTVSTLTAGQLNAWLNTKLGSRNSLMRNMGEAFMEAGKVSGLDPRYLVAHAAIESGWGTSNINTDKHNFYGIGAFDNSPYASAYDWSDPKDGIIGGAEWISKEYYEIGQTTLYTMRHDPTGGGHNYATDPQWHTKIASTMKGSEDFTTPSKEDANASSGGFNAPHHNGYTVTSEYGYRRHPIHGDIRLHAGIDLVGSGDKKIHPISSGEIVTINPVGINGLGNHVIIKHGVVKGKEVYSLYAHLSKFNSISVGQTVATNVVIGTEGTTGASTGVHLHLEVKEASPGGSWSTGEHVDPRNYVDF